MPRPLLQGMGREARHVQIATRSQLGQSWKRRSANRSLRASFPTMSRRQTKGTTASRDRNQLGLRRRKTWPLSPKADWVLVEIERKFRDTIFSFILNNDDTGLVSSNLSPSPLRFLYCLNVVGQFDAFLINHGHLTTANMKVVARHLVRPPLGERGQRSVRLLDPSRDGIPDLGKTHVQQAQKQIEAEAALLRSLCQWCEAATRIT